MLTGAQTLERYTDPASDKQIEAEARNLAERLQNVIYRSLAGRRDFGLYIHGNPTTQVVRIRWQDGSEESWTLDNIALQNRASGTASLYGSQYSSRFQTLTPAMTLRVHTVGKTSGPQGTTWHIAISAYGSTSLQRD